MGIKAGLVGLPNVGKSTLFNALTKSTVPAENYPFCTIDPHVAITEVPDERIAKLQKIYGSEKTLPASVTFVDIAGLVKGAASGEGLGNQFLSHIREVDLILHVLRCFEDSDIVHTSQKVDPLSDYDIIVSELMLKDLDSVEKRLPKIERDIKIAKVAAEKKAFEEERELLLTVQKQLNNADAQSVRETIEQSTATTIPLISAKKFLIIANIAEDEIDSYQNNIHYQALVNHFGADHVIPVSAKIENELAQLSEQDAAEMMEMIGLKEQSLHTIIRQTYRNLGLITFFTCGPKEIHAWPIKQGMNIRSSAGEIHSDLERGFIRADIFNYTDLITYGTIAKLKEAGKMRTEGQDYITQDGDIILVKFNV
ncbi:MAG: redox-regulated ATPase YchF [Candidatus Dependentiae bacterium]|nr:redox-regulated ATPase YchF [Candidatus Dependentiae bacterium]